MVFKVKPCNTVVILKCRSIVQIHYEGSRQVQRTRRIIERLRTNGFIDEDGYFTLTGRSSRFYIMSSLDKVYLDHVQSIISRFECVEACAVVKVKDEDLLFVNKAIIVPEDNYRDKDNLKDIILDLCKKPVTLANGKTDQLKVFEIPAYIELIDELPRKSGTDKIDYRMLEKQE